METSLETEAVSSLRVKTSCVIGAIELISIVRQTTGSGRTSKCLVNE